MQWNHITTFIAYTTKPHNHTHVPFYVTWTSSPISSPSEQHIHLLFCFTTTLTFCPPSLLLSLSLAHSLYISPSLSLLLCVSLSLLSLACSLSPSLNLMSLIKSLPSLLIAPSFSQTLFLSNTLYLKHSLSQTLFLSHTLYLKHSFSHTLFDSHAHLLLSFNLNSNK